MSCARPVQNINAPDAAAAVPLPRPCTEVRGERDGPRDASRVLVCATGITARRGEHVRRRCGSSDVGEPQRPHEQAAQERT
jgi:hypothetical protein